MKRECIVVHVRRVSLIIRLRLKAMINDDFSWQTDFFFFLQYDWRLHTPPFLFGLVSNYPTIDNFHFSLSTKE